MLRLLRLHTYLLLFSNCLVLLSAISPQRNTLRNAEALLGQQYYSSHITRALKLPFLLLESPADSFSLARDHKDQANY